MISKLNKGLQVSELTNKQSLFCKEYIIDFNATRAAIASGYSEKTAKEIGSENLTKPNIQAELARLMTERNEKVGIDAEWVLKEAADSYNFNKQEVFDSDGNPKMVNAASASKFLELVGKHTNIKAFDNTQEVTTNVTHNIMPVPVANSVDEWEQASKETHDKNLNEE